MEDDDRNKGAYRWTWFRKLRNRIQLRRHRGEKYLFDYSILSPSEKEKINKYLKLYKYYWKPLKERISNGR